MNQHTMVQWRDKKLAAVIQYPNSYSNDSSLFPVIVICHGFIGSKMGVNRLFVKASDALASQGYIVIRFDFAGCGESEGVYGEFGMEDLIDQTLQVIELAKGITRADKERIILLGHSLGGAVAVLSAAQAKIINKLVLWSAVGKPYEDIAEIIGAEKMERLEEAGTVDYQGYRLNKVFLESLKRHKPLDVGFEFKGNVLLVHGSKDEEITMQHCLSYFHTFQARNQGNCEKYIIDHADHVFSSGIFYNKLIEETKIWLAQERRFEKTLLQMNEQ